MSDNDCPCASGRSFETCCEPYLLGHLSPPTAEALMRARYSAYALCSIDYLYKTSGPRVKKEFDAEGSRKWAQSAEWLGLEVLTTDGGGAEDASGTVEFIAHYKIKDNTFDHHEFAKFARHDGEWRFMDGKVIGPEPVRREGPKIGRNDPCSCGSGKKFKKCCGATGGGTTEQPA
ncbi:MAG: YchJ family protein [Kiritimatiellae bacterium]|nr:YchJ family protein [Kiritimatiellia bacterium]